MMKLSAIRAAQCGALLIASLALAIPASACDKCHAGPDGDTCAAGCTCCGHSHAPSPGVQPHVLPPPEDGVVDVAMQDYLFSPDSIFVTPGTTVRWTNLDEEP